MRAWPPASTGCCGSPTSPADAARGRAGTGHDRPAPRSQVAAQPLAHGAADGDRHRRQRHAAAGRGEGAHRRAAELRRHHLRHRSHRRRPQRQPQAAALFGIPHRQRHQQRHLADLPGHRQAPRGGLDRAAVARRQPSRLPRARHHARLLHALQVPPGQGLAFRAGGPFSDLFDAVIGADVAARLGYKVGDPIVVGARAGLGRVRGARRQAVPRRRASWRGPARPSTAPCM